MFNALQSLRMVLTTVVVALAACPSGTGPETPAPPAPFPDGIAEANAPLTNFDQGTTCVSARHLRPRNVDEVLGAVRWAIGAGHRIKAVSSAASHSEQDIICPVDEGVQLNLVDMDAVLSVDAEAMLVRVEPGITMGALGDALHAEGFGLRNHIPLRDVTAAGAIATGAHHTSLRFPSGIHDMVQRLVLVDGTGTLQVLDGQAAREVSAHLGVLGVVVEVGFAIVPQYKLRAEVTSGDDGTLEDDIVTIATSHDHASLSWFVGQGSYTLRATDIVTADTPGEAWSTNWHSTPEEQSLLASLSDGLNRAPDGEQQMCAVAALRAADVGLSHADADGPIDGEAAVGWSHQVFSSTCVGLECPWNNGLKIFNPEVAIAVADLPDWMREVRKLHAQRPMCFPINGIVIRFSTASDSLVGMNADYDVAYVEWHIARHPDPGINEPYQDVYDEIHQFTLGRFNGRPHWGKNYPATFYGLDTAALYTQWGAFETLRETFDPAGVFENPFWHRVTGEQGQASPVLSSGCATDRRCWCSEDAHCGPGWACQSGLVATTARVCRKVSP